VPEAERLLPGMDERRRLASAHAVTPDGSVYSGGDVAAPLLELLPGGSPLARLVRVAPGVARVIYNLVAARRGTIGRRLPRDAVARATERIDAHG
jgi:predicted DCC family thiol-disulfide oxidoreductase YuxK